MKALATEGLDNRRQNKVKIIVHPMYLEGNDGLVDLPCYDAISGCYLGVFPSYYEPWGYTPMESVSMGVPAVTTDLAGFGRFVKPHTKGNMEDGTFVIERFGKKEEYVIERMASTIYEYINRNKRERMMNKLAAKELADMADWKFLIDNYILAHNLALEKKGQ
jgi:glycosyltransferase involved in cell wall biosynthesis